MVEIQAIIFIIDEVYFSSLPFPVWSETVLFKGEGGVYIRDGTATLPVGGSTVNQFKALTNVCTSSHIFNDQITISIQNVSMLYMNVP